MKQLKVGIIGQGRSGYSIHVHSLSQMTDMFTIVAVSDPIEERMNEARERNGATGYTDYRDLIARDDLDLVVNASPSHLHVAITKEALLAGRNVLCEKPMARTAAEADEVISLAKRHKRFFDVFQQSRFAPYFAKVREVIDSGVLGRVVMIKVAFNGFSRRWDWQTLQEYNGGNLLNTGPHPVDQALELFGPDEMPRVTCFMDRANTCGDAEDFVKLILSGDGHPLIDVEISSCDAYPLYTYHVHGEHGGLTGDMKRINWKYYAPAEAPSQKLQRQPLPGRQYCREDLPMHEESWEIPPSESNLFDTMAGKYYRNLYAALTEGAEMTVKPQQVRRQIAVMEECHRQCPLSRLGG